VKINPIFDFKIKYILILFLSPSVTLLFIIIIHFRFERSDEYIDFTMIE